MTKYLDHIAIKQRNGQAGEPIPIGITFDKVYLTDEEGQTINLEQMYNNYMRFMKNADFVHAGPNEPQNKHIKIWIDTYSTNQDNLISS